MKPGPMKNKSYAFVVMLLFIIPNLYYITIGRESFPFTQAPMFGHYVGEDTRFFSFHYILESDSTRQEIFPDYNIKMPLAEISLKRFFFNSIYGSVEKKSPFGYYENDTKEALEGRMGLYFQAFFQSHINKNSKIWVDIIQYNRQYATKDKHTIGYFDGVTNRFVHTWKVN